MKQLEGLFWTTLFKADDAVCFGKTIFDTKAIKLSELSAEQRRAYPYFAINPLTEKRADANVTCFKNILVEFDSIAPEAQLEIINKMPHTAVTWSGGKSYHAIISLQEPMPHRAAYDALIRQIYAKVPMADKSAKNPSRFSRTPNAIRDNGNKQTCIYVGNKVTQQQLFDWIGPAVANLKTEQSFKYSLALSSWTLYFLAFGAPAGQRNQRLFNAACDMARHGYTEEQALEKAAQVLDLPTHEMISCIKSAFKKVKD